MKTKAQIVQQLLEEKKITVEEAMTLLMNDAPPIQYIPQPYPVFPPQPWQPWPWQSPQSLFITISNVTP